ncbi:nuclear transport factor 2 family protein [Actinomadura darangshiensis]|uniref:Nuclear transport factor 2 family protein n=1 Tax=Actinomadura darangshiensis TaxID=705336 RepID=A0A4R5AG53_9ACTN|nr:nuclear transport factor 2 family protein [Actinomadura darangshiensis]TDD68992.1 nuclear transport factor 2 family protein [Actinomadura darangshiensis]
MGFTADDRTQITELISMHGHLCDSGELERLDDLFTPDAVYDVSDFGQEPLLGSAARIEAARALGERNPVGHHVTNVVLTDVADDRVHARTKGIGVYADGTAGSVTYEDTIVRTPQGWRISHRKIRAHRAPLGGRA